MRASGLYSKNLFVIMLILVSILSIYNRKLYHAFTGCITRIQTLRKRKIPHPVNISDKTMVLLVVGNSNAANYCQSSEVSAGNVYNIYQADYYYARDPLLGADGSMGSIWTPLSDQVLKEELYESVAIANVSRGSSTIVDWTEQGKYRAILDKQLRALDKLKIAAKYCVIWFGENENLLGLSPELVRTAYIELINKLKSHMPQSKIFIVTSSYHRGKQYIVGVNEAIREAQISMVDERQGIYGGIDTDSLILAEDRYDGLHYSQIGVSKINKMFMQKIRLVESN